MLTPPAALEALLFAAGEPVEKKRLATLLGISKGQVATALEALGATLEGRGLGLIDSGEKVELRTTSEAAPLLKKFREAELSRDLGKAGLETLAIIAYRSGATRSEIDWIRGVNSSTSLRNLLMRGLVDRYEDPKDARKLRYRLTTEALAHIGVASAKELPHYGELSHDAKAASEESHGTL